MDESIKIAAKFKNISSLIFFVFVVMTIVLSVTFSYLFNNYWLLFAIPIALYSPKVQKLFVLTTIGIIIYWFVKGFRFSDELTFFWISSLFGLLCQLFVKTYEDLAEKIIEKHSSDIISGIIDNIQDRNEMLNKKSDAK